MKNIEEFDVKDTTLWHLVKKGLTKNWLENEADTKDLDFLVQLYNDEYDGRIFDNQEDAIFDSFSDVYEAFTCATESEGNYSNDDSWFKVEKNDYLLYGYDDNSMLDKIIDEMSSDICNLARNIEDNIVDDDNAYREIVKDITLIQRYYLKTLEGINADLFKYIDENTSQGYGVADLKENLVGFEDKCKTIKIVSKSEKLTELIEERNTRVKELLNTNSEFLKGALYNTVIDNNAKSICDVYYQLSNYYGVSDEFIERHKDVFSEVNLNFSKIGEFII